MSDTPHVTAPQNSPATNVVMFPPNRSRVASLSLDEVVMYCVSVRGCREMAEAVADPETVSYNLTSHVSAAETFLKRPPHAGLAALPGLRLPHRSIWVEYDRGRKTRGVQAEMLPNGEILLRHVSRAGPRSLGMPAAWTRFDIRTPSPTVDVAALVAEHPVKNAAIDQDWLTWLQKVSEPVRTDDRGMTGDEYLRWLHWAYFDLALLWSAFAEVRAPLPVTGARWGQSNAV